MFSFQQKNKPQKTISDFAKKSRKRDENRRLFLMNSEIFEVLDSN